MSPTAFIRRPQRWIQALATESRHGRVVTAAPNFAYEWTAQRGLARTGRGHRPQQCRDDHRLRTGQHRCDRTFNKAFAPYGLPRYGDQTLLRHRRGDAVRFDHRARRRTPRLCTSTASSWAPAQACASRRMPPARRRTCPAAGSRAASGRDRRPRLPATELPDGEVGEIWLQGNNIGRGYWGRPEETRLTFRRHAGVPASAQGSHAEGDSARRHLAAHRRPGRVSRRGALRYRPDCRSGDRSRAGTTIRRTSRPRPRRPRRWCGGDMSWRSPCRPMQLPESRWRHRRGPGDHRRTCRRAQAAPTQAGDRGDQGGGVATTWAVGLRRAPATGRCHPADHQRQAGPPGVPGPIPQRRVWIAGVKRSAYAML